VNSPRTAEPAHRRKVRHLIEYQRYFGIDARAFHAGAQRVHARMAAQGWDETTVDASSLSEDFALDPIAGAVLQRALLAAGLLNPDGAGAYHPTARFREYAMAPLLSPLSREAARSTIDKARALAAQVNATWAANPHLIDTIAVAGSFMSRCDPLPELSFWLVVRKRPRTAEQRSLPVPSDAGGLRQIAAALKALSPFVVVHRASDRDDVPRPFIVAYDAPDEVTTSPASTWDRLRRWSAALNGRLALR
jgi:hypothetical protein